MGRLLAVLLISVFTFMSHRVSLVFLVELLGAIRPFEIMALTRNRKQECRHQQKGEKFHCAA